MFRQFFLILFLLLAVSASAQVKVTGRVIDLQNKPVSDVIVKLVSGSKTLAFTSTNARGEYNLEVKNAPTGEVSLQFTHISYEKESEKAIAKGAGDQGGYGADSEGSFAEGGYGEARPAAAEGRHAEP